MAMKISLESVKDTVRDYLNSQGWRFDEDEKLFRYGMNIRCKLGSVNVRILCNEGHFTCYTYAKINASPDVRTNAMKYLTYANYGLKRGNFEMDQNDGEIRYKSFLGFGDSFPSADEVELAVDIGMIMFERYGDGLLSVMFAGEDPKTACENAERR